MASVLVPVLYVVIIIGSLLIFSYFYRKSTAAKSVEPYFPSHPDRDVYVTLLQKTDPPANETLLKAALVRRAMADVTRVLRLREDKPALQNLLQKGSVGDDLWNSLLAAEKELEAEIMEVVAEANSFVEGWGQIIFQTANETIANEKMRSVFEHTAEARAEKEKKYGKQSKAVSVATSAAIAPPSSNVHTVPSGDTAPQAKPADSLAPPSNAPAEDTPSSDGEKPDTSSTPRSPSKAPAKRGKRRK